MFIEQEKIKKTITRVIIEEKNNIYESKPFLKEMRFFKDNKRNL